MTAPLALAYTNAGSEGVTEEPAIRPDALMAEGWKFEKA
jgi:hypothetical protein